MTWLKFLNADIFQSRNLLKVVLKFDDMSKSRISDGHTVYISVGSNRSNLKLKNHRIIAHEETTMCE